MKHNLFIFSLIVIIFATISCTKNNGKSIKHPSSEEKPFAPKYSLTNLHIHTGFDTIAETKGIVNNIVEVSGIDKSLSNPGKLWVHNDGGHGEFIFLLDAETGECLQSFKLPQISNVDWEDIATFRDLSNNQNYVYLADIGNNSGDKKRFILYRLVEPAYDPAKRNDTIVYYGGVEKVYFNYPKQSFNAEAIMTDPLNGEIILATNTKDTTNIFKINPENMQVKFLGTLPFGRVSGGDITEDRHQIILKTFREVLIWEIIDGETIASAFSRPPQKAPYKTEPQGESICWYNGGYFTLSEKVGDILPPLYYYRKID